MAEQPVAETVRPLFTTETIARRIDEMARDIAACDLHDPLIVAVLKGSFIFAADLIRALSGHGLHPEIDFIFLASYGGGTTGGVVKILRDVESVIEGRDVVIVDDILDSGHTLAFAKERLAERGARGVKTCILLNKQAPRGLDITPDFTGFECPDLFVVGYGMDLAHRYRELPFIGVVETERA
jgi:hypoxanthine phosphoribosyltransferase